MKINIRIILTGLLLVSLAFSGGLSKAEKAIQTYIDKHVEEAIDLIEKVVNINSGTLNIDGNKTVGNKINAYTNIFSLVALTPDVIGSMGILAFL